MDKHDITTITYGGRVDTDAKTMVDGMIELFDDLCDMALSRIYNRLRQLDSGFDFAAIPTEQVSTYKITWVICLAELMFHSMTDQAKLDELKQTFYAEMDYEADQRRMSAYIAETLKSVPLKIAADTDFVENELFNRPLSNRDEDKPRNRGLGPDLAAIIFDNAFGDNPALASFSDELRPLVEVEFNNAYGHASIACSKFTIV